MKPLINKFLLVAGSISLVVSIIGFIIPRPHSDFVVFLPAFKSFAGLVLSSLYIAWAFKILHSYVKRLIIYLCVLAVFIPSLYSVAISALGWGGFIFLYGAITLWSFLYLMPSLCLATRRWQKAVFILGCFPLLWLMVFGPQLVKYLVTLTLVQPGPAILPYFIHNTLAVFIPQMLLGLYVLGWNHHTSSLIDSNPKAAAN